MLLGVDNKSASWAARNKLCCKCVCIVGLGREEEGDNAAMWDLAEWEAATMTSPSSADPVGLHPTFGGTPPPPRDKGKRQENQV